MARRILCVIAAVFIAMYLFIGRGQWFSELERQAKIGTQKIYSSNVDLSKSDEFVWEIPRDSWAYEEGEAEFSLVLDRAPNIPTDAYSKDNMLLRVRVDAYAKLENGEQVDRLIKNWYFLTNEPFSPNAHLWESWGNKNIEYGLGGIYVYPFEKVYIKVSVLVPDTKLAKANPRIQLVGKHDYAIFEHITFLRLLRDSGLFLCLTFLLVLAAFAWKNPTKSSASLNS